VGDLLLAKRLKRDLRVIAAVTAMNLRARLEYRTDFVLSIALGIAWQSSVIVFATVLLTRFPGLGGWTSPQVLLIASMRLVSHGFYVLVLGRSGGAFPFIVMDGRIDVYLLRPMPVYRQVQLSSLSVNAFGDIFVALTMFGFALARFDLSWTPLRAGYVAAGLVGGFFAEAAITTTMSCVTLHFPASQYWTNWVDELMATFGAYPLNILPRLVQGGFTYLLPVAFIAYLPAAVVTGHLNGIGVPVSVAMSAPVIAVVGYVASRLLFNASLSRYQGVNV
jgi:ABC-2 type transport system permease protein